MGPSQDGSLCRLSLAAHPARGLAYLQGQLVSKEGANEIAGVSADPAQEEPQGQGLVHVARLAGLDVLAVAEEGDVCSGADSCDTAWRVKWEQPTWNSGAGAASAQGVAWELILPAGGILMGLSLPFGDSYQGIPSKPGALWDMHLSRESHCMIDSPPQRSLGGDLGLYRVLMFCVRP